MSGTKLDAYVTYSYKAFGRMLLDMFFQKDPLKRLSLKNQMSDYTSLSTNKELLDLHAKCLSCLMKSKHEWPSYDYGQGYFYQSLSKVHITGYRDTLARIQDLDLDSRLNQRSVLEIGCNTGFIPLEMNPVFNKWVAFDINPYLIEIANTVNQFLNRDNIDYRVGSFEQWVPDKSFDVVLSFANHSTYDKNTKQSLKEYFRKCAQCLKPGGQLLFESHPPSYEKDGLAHAVKIIEQFFTIEEKRVITTGTTFDRLRTFISGRKI